MLRNAEQVSAHYRGNKMMENKTKIIAGAPDKSAHTTRKTKKMQNTGID